jgi:hypothetical protein
MFVNVQLNSQVSVKMFLSFVKFELSDGDDSPFESQECTSVADFAINSLPVVIWSNNQTSNMHNLM